MSRALWPLACREWRRAMIEPLAELVAANLSFVGLHFALSHPLRAPLLRGLGERGFQGFYSFVSLAAFAWVVIAFRAAPPVELAGYGETGWILAQLLRRLSLVLLDDINECHCDGK